jgi:PAS domain S-box-containing protein
LRAGLRPEDLGIGRLFWRIADAVVVGSTDDGRVQLWNPAAERLFGYTAEEAVGQLIETILVPERFRAAHRRGLASYSQVGHGRLIDGQAPVQLHALRKDGTEIAVELTLGAIDEIATGGRFVLALIRDASARAAAARAEAELARAEAAHAGEARFRELFDRVPIGLYRSTPDGRILEANPALVEMLGYPDQAALLAARTGDIVLDERLGREHAALERAGVVRGFELRLRRRDGRVIWALDSARAVRDDAGRVVAFEGSLQDVTERRRAEQATRMLATASAALVASLDYAHTLEAVARQALPTLADWCAVDLIDADGQPTTVASAHVDPASERLLRQVQRRYPVTPAGDLPTSRAMRTGQSVLIEVVDAATLAATSVDPEHARLRRAIGVDTQIAVPLIARGQVLGAITFGRSAGDRYDAADLAVAEELARLASAAVDNARLYYDAQAGIRARDDFLSIAAHELKTPVAGLKAGAQLLARTLGRGPVETARLGRMLVRLDEAASRVAGLTDDLLDVARIRTGRLPHQPRSVDLASLVAGTVERAREALGPAHPIVLDLPAGGLPIVVDPERIDQVVTNLVENAVKYSPGGGEVRVELGREGAGALLRVRDRGIGLPSESAERIFEPFNRATNAQAAHIPGMGLGLHICRSIVERHGGWIRAESPGVGLGTDLLVFLPDALAPPEGMP